MHLKHLMDLLQSLSLFALYRRPSDFGYAQRQHVPLSCVKLPIQNCFDIFGCFDQPHIASHIA